MNLHDMLIKKIVNDSRFHLRVTVFLRFGNDPLIEGGVKSFAVKVGATEEVTLSANPKALINGIGLSYFDSECSMYFEKKILESGSTFDQFLNGSDQILIEDPTKMVMPCTAVH